MKISLRDNMTNSIMKVPQGDYAIGTCFSKCIQANIKLYLKDIDTKFLLGIENNLKLRYFNRLSDERLYIGKIFGNGRKETLEEINMKLEQVSLREYYCENENDAQLLIREFLKQNIPVIVGVNPYYIYYMKDYLRTPGGYFKAYHMCLVVGENATEYILADPVCDFALMRIPKNEFILAWTYEEGIKNFKPYLYYILDCKLFQCNKNLVNICFQSAISNLEYMIEFNAVISQMIMDIKEISLEEESEEKIIFFQNIAHSIFNTVSNSRKLFGEFLNTDFLELNDDCLMYAKIYKEELFEKWQMLGKLLMIYSGTYSGKRLSKICKYFEELKQKELKVATLLLQELKDLKRDVNA